MAVEEIVIRYKADVSGLEAEINDLIAAQGKLTKEVKANTDEQKKAATTQEFAAKKRTELLRLEEERLKKLRDAQRLAFDPKEIQRFNREIEQSQRNIDTLSGKANQAKGAFSGLGNSIVGQFKGVAAGIAAAFSVQAILGFAKQSFNAFLEAEKSVNKLRFSVTNLDGASDAAFQKLVKQSSEVQKVSIFGDEAIQEAQAALLAFGLTTDEVEKLIPKLADFATVAGTDILTAANQVGAGLEGAGRAFKKYGIEVEASKSRQENLNSILDGFNKFAGSAANATDTLSGKYQQQKNIIGDLQEVIGERLAPVFLKLQTAGLKALEAFTRLFGAEQQTALQKTTANLRAQQSEFLILSDTLKGTNLSTETRKQLVTELNAKYGEYLPKLLTETSSLKDIEEAQKAVNKQIEGRILLAGLEERIAEALKNAAAGQSLVTRGNKNLTAGLKDLSDNAAAAANNLDFNNNVIKTGEALIENTSGTIEGLKEEYEELRKALGIVTQDTKEFIEVSKEEQKTIDEKAKLLKTLQGELLKLQQQQEQQQIELINPKSFDDAIDKYTKLAEVQKKAVDDEIDNKIAEAKANKTFTDEIGAEFEKIRKFRKDAIDFQKLNQITIFDEQQQEQITASLKAIEDLNFQKSLEIKADEIEANNQKVADSFKDLQDNLGRFDVQKFRDNLIENTKFLKASIQERADLEIENIEKTRDRELALTDDTEVGQAKKAEIIAKSNDKIIELENDKSDKIKEIDAKTNLALEESNRSRLSKTILAYQQELQLVGNIYNEIAALSSQATDKRINDINRELDARLEAIEIEKEANKEDLELRRISEEEFNANEKRLLQESVKAEEEAQKKIREQKRKQAILDKAGALFQIALNTAIALSNPSNIASFGALSGLYLALAGLQAAAVLAQPIPYRKGSKDTGRQGHLARVGEEGEELVFMPANSKVLPAKQTRKYSEIIDAMYDNKLDKYIQKNYVIPAVKETHVKKYNEIIDRVYQKKIENYTVKNYITPVLVQSKQKSEETKSKTFAENISKSITYNTLGLTPNDLEAQRKRGQYIRNVDEIAAAIAKHIPTNDPYRV